LRLQSEGPKSGQGHEAVLDSLAQVVGGGQVASKVFDANLRDPQIARVESWLAGLNAGCPDQVAAILVGHSLGGDGAIRVKYDNICSRILLDAFDPALLSMQCRDALLNCNLANPLGCPAAALACLDFFDQSDDPPRTPPPPSEGLVFSFLAEFPDVFQGRRFSIAPNVAQQCVKGTDHNSIVTAVVGTGAFQDSIVGHEIDRCVSASPPPTLGMDIPCDSSTSSILPGILGFQP